MAAELKIYRQYTKYFRWQNSDLEDTYFKLEICFCLKEVSLFRTLVFLKEGQCVTMLPRPRRLVLGHSPWCKASPCWICSGRRSAGTIFSPTSSIFTLHYHFTNAPYSFPHFIFGLCGFLFQGTDFILNNFTKFIKIQRKLNVKLNRYNNRNF